MNTQAYLQSLEARIRDLEAIAGKNPVRMNMMQNKRGKYVGRVKTSTTFARGGTGTIIRHKVGASGGTSAVSPTKEDTVVDPGAISGGPLAASTLVYYEIIDGVLTYTGHDCNG